MEQNANQSAAADDASLNLGVLVTGEVLWFDQERAQLC